MSSTKPDRRELLPCLTAEIIDDMVAGQPLDGLPSESDPAPGPLSPRERLLFHFLVFVIVSWNLGMINLAHSLGHLWLWPWFAVWVGVLLVHLGIVYASTCRGREKGMQRV